MFRQFVILLLLLPNVLFGQEYKIPRALIWGGNTYLKEGVELLNFSGASYPDKETYFPYYDELLRSDLFYNGVIELSDVTCEEIEPEMLRKVQNLNLLPDTITISVIQSSARAVDYLRLSVLPVYKNRMSGKIFRVKSFNISFSANEKGLKPIKSSTKSAAYASNSVLSTGEWYKIKVGADGVYKLSYSQIKEIGISNPAKLHIFGNGGKMLPAKPLDYRKDDLLEIPILMEKGTDGVFNEGDYVVFYAQGPNKWTYSPENNLYRHTLNKFNDYSYYFLTANDQPILSISSIASLSADGASDVTSFDDYYFHEKDIYNVGRTGSEWYGELFDVTLKYDFSVSFADIDNSSDAKFYCSLIARSPYSSICAVQINGSTKSNLSFPLVDMYTSTGDFAKSSNTVFDFLFGSETANISFVYSKNGASNALAYLNSFGVNVRRHLIYRGSQLSFRDCKSLLPGGKAKFILNNATAGIEVWDVTNINNVKKINTQFSAGDLKFVASTDTLSEYIAFDKSSALLTPTISGEGLGLVPNQNLHGLAIPDLIIVAPNNNEVKAWADTLARFRESNDGLKVVVVTTSQIFNEFASGSLEVTAIRDFVSMFYNRGIVEGTMPKYLLLFGDGTLDNKTVDENNSNLIPVYESDEAINLGTSYVSDDYFGWLDDKGNNENALLDIGIGRLPVKNADEAEVVVRKIIRYTSLDALGDWRNDICFIGDDEDGNEHMKNANNLSGIVANNKKSMNIKKIFLDAYPQKTTTSGQAYPDVNVAINNQVNKGALIVNYTGHGNEKQLAHEVVINSNSIKSWANKNTLPLFITATCEFSRFDDVNVEGERTKFSDRTTGGESIILSPTGGGVALLTTTRLVYSSDNYELNREFYNCLFNDESYRLGDLIRITKNNTSASVNKLNFTLLGDPSMKLAIPKNLNFVTDSVNGVAVSDTSSVVFKALSVNTVAGHVERATGGDIDDFNGLINTTLFDKQNIINTLNNDGDGVFTFISRESVVYKGISTVKDGNFNYTFIVPKDINYNVGEGKINYYAVDDKNIDYSGVAKDTVFVGDMIDNPVDDNDGPKVDLYINDTTFKSGGLTNSNPKLLALVFDDNGINTTGAGIGHDIIAVLDNDYENSFVLNSYYRANVNTYKSGRVEFPLSGLTEGSHTMYLKVWDSYNNSSESEIEFNVKDPNSFTVRNVMNYPNPFSYSTSFVFEHNLVEEDINIEISIYNISGSLVAKINDKSYTTGFRSKPIVWVPSRNITQGVYFYKIKAFGASGKAADGRGKLLIQR
jgi:hypothetical protein